MSSLPGTFVAIQSVNVPPRSIAISMPALGGTGGGVMAEGILKLVPNVMYGVSSIRDSEEMKEEKELHC